MLPTAYQTYGKSWRTAFPKFAQPHWCLWAETAKFKWREIAPNLKSNVMHLIGFNTIFWVFFTDSGGKYVRQNSKYVPVFAIFTNNQSWTRANSETKFWQLKNKDTTATSAPKTHHFLISIIAPQNNCRARIFVCRIKKHSLYLNKYKVKYLVAII